MKQLIAKRIIAVAPFVCRALLIKLAAILISLSAVLFVCIGQAFCQETITIGLLAPLTGEWSYEGAQMKQVVDLLAKECNARGGLLGKKVSVVSEDDAGDTKIAITAAQKLVARQPVAVIGAYSSGITAAVQPTFNKAGIIQITNASTVVNLTEKGFKYFFRICPRDDDQALTVAEALKDHGYKKIAILHDNTLYSRRLADRTKTQLKDGGIKIACDQELTPGSKDYRAILNSLKEQQPDVVFFTGYYPEAGILLRQKKDMGWNVPFFGGDGSYSSELVKIAGNKAAAGFHFFSLPLIQNLPSPEAKKFLLDFYKQYGKQLTSVNGLLAGDAFKVISAAIAATGMSDMHRISQYIHNDMKNFPGLSGMITFNEKGDRVGRIFVEYRLDEKGDAVLQF